MQRSRADGTPEAAATASIGDLCRCCESNQKISIEGQLWWWHPPQGVVPEHPKPPARHCTVAFTFLARMTQSLFFLIKARQMMSHVMAHVMSYVFPIDRQFDEPDNIYK